MLVCKMEIHSQSAIMSNRILANLCTLGWLASDSSVTVLFIILSVRSVEKGICYGVSS